MSEFLPFQHYLTAKLEMSVCQDNEASLIPSITLSRQAGARAISIAEKLEAYLKSHTEYQESSWTLFDQNLVEIIIEDNHLSPDVEPQLSEGRVHMVADVIREVFKTKVSDWTLFQHTVHTIRKLCGMGHAIVVGRGGNFIAADLTNTFAVRLVGSFDKRREHLKEKFGMSNKAAESYIHEKDAGRRQFVKSHLHRDLEDPASYDLTINTDHLADDTVVSIIAHALEAWGKGLKETTSAELEIATS